MVASGSEKRMIGGDANEPATLGEAAYQRLRTDIVTGAFKGGMPLRLEALRQRYGFSFSPLREALMRLQSERLVLSTALRGFSVAPLSREEMQDATETRILIESEALRRSMRDGDDNWEAGIVAAFHALSRQVERQSQASGKLEMAEISAMEERHHQFHRSLIAACGSPRLLELADQLYVETQRYRLPNLIGQVAPKKRRNVAKEHQEIMEASLQRSQDAVRLLAEHYRRTSDIIRASMEE
ncbi:DNA-binding transcriptional regulator, GntR family [Bradyrhizobium erythrophlei]|jgi:GntR family carbon starvation induced transcriptional regulator|uniref:DNA-binding transcriptional regulator, GntR family n=2 Tax=Bradyrhizobium erythrophlei TaxID=1437360 RepID=A0A1M7TNZ4_9BRAD|nr:DNA-binding transcriptional regulator, GntR family [Bradyrhizobium erythrophlei]